MGDVRKRLERATRRVAPTWPDKKIPESTPGIWSLDSEIWAWSAGAELPLLVLPFQGIEIRLPVVIVFPLHPL
jgi:hypothetical protein